nr:unnamed protein product [Digitaria exilis]
MAPRRVMADPLKSAASSPAPPPPLPFPSSAETGSSCPLSPPPFAISPPLRPGSPLLPRSAPLPPARVHAEAEDEEQQEQEDISVPTHLSLARCTRRPRNKSGRFVRCAALVTGRLLPPLFAAARRLADSAVRSPVSGSTGLGKLLPHRAPARLAACLASAAAAFY